MRNQINYITKNILYILHNLQFFLNMLVVLVLKKKYYIIVMNERKFYFPTYINKLT